MAKSKYKKVVPQTQQPIAQAKPTILIHSDGNVIELQGINGDVRVYKYIKSNTKLGAIVTFNSVEMAKFLNSNQLIKPVKFKEL